MAEYTINELVNLSGVNRRNIHFYVQQGILPPPEGAGLGARYGDEHLIRLRAIPILRNRGLRLDQIRERLAGANLRPLEAIIAEEAAPIVPARSAQPYSPARLHSQPITRYTLAPGVELFVDAVIDSGSQAQISELIRAAQRIFNNQHDPHNNGGK